MLENAAVGVDGPAWCARGMTDRGSRYPLAVEAPVLRMVNVLVPGVSTLTDSARHFALYWAVAQRCGSEGYDAATCRDVIRRSESALAWASLVDPETGGLNGPAAMHGADTVRRLLSQVQEDELGEHLVATYSPRSWGYWSQYTGPATTLGIVSVDKNSLRPGPRACPAQVQEMFSPLLDIASHRAVKQAEIGDFISLANPGLGGPDIEPLRGLITATPDSVDTSRWSGDDLTRRSTLRILARAVQLVPDQTDWRAIFSAAIAFGPHLDIDPIYQEEGARAQAWRGVLLRHRLVGAWRILWAALVGHVLNSGEPLNRAQLHEWIRSHVPAVTMGQFRADLPATRDANGHPLPAEDDVEGQGREPIESALAALVLSSQRIEELGGTALDAFRGGSTAPRRVFLDPYWVGARAGEYADQWIGDFAAAVVDDMLAQSHRVALRKLEVKADGSVVMPSKLYEREGRYFAESAEGAYNIGYRAETVGSIAIQLGLINRGPEGLDVTGIGSQLLELPG